jgi:hypothetical protein
MYTPNVIERSRHGKNFESTGNPQLRPNRRYAIPTVTPVEKFELQPARFNSIKLGRLALDLTSDQSASRKQVREVLSREVREQNAA